VADGIADIAAVMDTRNGKATAPVNAVSAEIVLMNLMTPQSSVNK
jgi:hypothetical protein